MKLAFVLVASLLAVPSVFAEPEKDKSAKETPATESAETFIKKIYDLAKNNKGPFFETQNKAAMEKWLAKDLAALIAKDAAASKDEVGVLDFDPLYNAQDVEVTDFKLTTEKKGDVTQVTASFKNLGEADTVRFIMAQGADKIWKIADIRYKDDTSLKKMLEEGLKEGEGKN